MAKGSEIVVSALPMGHWEECVFSGAVYPGTCVEIVPSTNPVGGRFSYRNTTRANGAKGPVAVVINDSKQGQLPTTQISSGQRGQIYWPCAGEELNMRVSESVGTGTAGEENIGDLLAVQMTSGELMAGGALASQPFWLLEHGGVDSGDTLKLCKYLGNLA